jgi:hypothetical protein
MTERRSSLDPDAAMAALEGRARAAQADGKDEALAKAARLPRRAPKQLFRLWGTARLPACAAGAPAERTCSPPAPAPRP